MSDFRRLRCYFGFDPKFYRIPVIFFCVIFKTVVLRFFSWRHQTPNSGKFYFRQN